MVVIYDLNFDYLGKINRLSDEIHLAIAQSVFASLFHSTMNSNVESSERKWILQKLPYTDVGP